jgi:hypothetical protein
MLWVHAKEIFIFASDESVIERERLPDVIDRLGGFENWIKLNADDLRVWWWWWDRSEILVARLLLNESGFIESLRFNFQCPAERMTMQV